MNEPLPPASEPVEPAARCRICVQPIERVAGRGWVHVGGVISCFLGTAPIGWTARPRVLDEIEQRHVDPDRTGRDHPASVAKLLRQIRGVA